jgi:hypothetical protein
MQMVVRQLVGDDLVIKDVAFCVMREAGRRKFRLM